jgi:SAM-dependent methyltransferase
MPNIQWGTHTRTVLDVGCGVASFGGYLLDRNVISMSFALKDEHKAQIQFALERGIPAFLAVIATQKLPFPDNAFDVVHCARCRVHWYANGKCPINLFLHFIYQKLIYCSTILFFSTAKSIFLFFLESSCSTYFLIGMAGGKPLLELNRVLRPGGYFIWSATPVYRREKRFQDDWNGTLGHQFLLRTAFKYLS